MFLTEKFKKRHRQETEVGLRTAEKPHSLKAPSYSATFVCGLSLYNCTVLDVITQQSGGLADSSLLLPFIFFFCVFSFDTTLTCSRSRARAAQMRESRVKGDPVLTYSAAVGGNLEEHCCLSQGLSLSNNFFSLAEWRKQHGLQPRVLYMPPASSRAACTFFFFF